MNGHTNGLRSTPNDINDRLEMKDRSRNSVSNEQNSLQDDSSLWVESKNVGFFHFTPNLGLNLKTINTFLKNLRIILTIRRAI
jgi:hypothetical protein